jgi:aminoglycoside phosphotransferase (APT) family kinase protein
MTEHVDDPRDLPGLSVEPVARWVLEHVPGLTAPLRAAALSGGHSNLTFTLTDATGRRCVLRRPPLGEEPGGAHDMRREYRVIAALRATTVPVAAALALCEDTDVNGPAFYVMAHVDANVVDNPVAAERSLPSAHLRRRASEQLVDVLADLHRVDVDAVGLGDVGKREDFLARQLHRMSRVWAQTKTRELPLVDELHGRLARRAPAQRYTGIVHSDYRFGNVMLAADGTLAAVLDWELWTLGDVLADVGFMLNNWYEPGDDTPLVWMEVPPTVAGGFATRDEVVERYAVRTGFDLGDIEFYRAFQHWKVAILAEGVKRRYEQASLAPADVDFAHLDRRVVDLAEQAHIHLALA